VKTPTVDIRYANFVAPATHKVNLITHKYARPRSIVGRIERRNDEDMHSGSAFPDEAQARGSANSQIAKSLCRVESTVITADLQFHSHSRSPHSAAGTGAHSSRNRRPDPVNSTPP
jgi:hypothetical protein